MQLFKTVLSLAFLAGSVFAQNAQLTYPHPGSKLTAGSNFTVQVYMGGYPESIDVVSIVIGIQPCLGGTCSPPSSFVGTVLYQGPYTRVPGTYYANYTVTVPDYFPLGLASVNAIDLFLVGAENEPIVDYLNATVTVVAKKK